MSDATQRLPSTQSIGGTGFKSEFWKVKNHTENAPQTIFTAFWKISESWKPAVARKVPAMTFQTASKTELCYIQRKHWSMWPMTTEGNTKCQHVSQETLCNQYNQSQQKVQLSCVMYRQHKHNHQFDQWQQKHYEVPSCAMQTLSSIQSVTTISSTERCTEMYSSVVSHNSKHYRVLCVTVNITISHNRKHYLTLCDPVINHNQCNQLQEKGTESCVTL